MMYSPLADDRKHLLHNTQFGARPFLAERFQHLQAAAFHHVEVQPLSPVLGALVSGVNLAKPISDEALHDLIRARLLYRVLFFCDQEITSDQHTAFASRFGEIEGHHFLKNAEDARHWRERYRKLLRMQSMSAQRQRRTKADRLSVQRRENCLIGW
jgi:alpha-ketoglutarate-dependent taurine dioxygenase